MTTSAPRPVLALDAVTVQYGGVRAVDSVSLSVSAGRVVGLIGPNGAGKTSLLDAISGFTRYSGSVMLEGVPLDGLPGHRRSRQGLVRSFQGAELFDDLTVWENVVIGAGSASGEESVAARSRWAIEAMGLGDVTEAAPGQLPNGRRKLVGVARAIAGRPTVVLLDEPAAGLDATESRLFADKLRGLTADGTTVLIIDHDMRLMLSVCDEIHVLDLGRLIASGTPAQVRQDLAVRLAYLGAAAEPAAVPAASPRPRTARTGSSPVTPGGPSSTRDAAEPRIRCSGVSAGYGAVRVLHDVDMTVGAGEVVSLLGPNGAGKTTLIRALSGLIPTTSGDVHLDGLRMGRTPTHRRSRAGLAVIPERRGVFASLSVADNLTVGAPRGSSALTEVMDRFPVLRSRAKVAAGMLSGGEQQMLTVARAFASRPRVLLIDELTSGLAPAVGASLLPVITELASEHGTAVLLVDQNSDLVLSASERCYVLVNGRVVLHAPSAQLRGDPDALGELYLGDQLEPTGGPA